jgi:hypothetical protein
VPLVPRLPGKRGTRQCESAERFRIACPHKAAHALSCSCVTTAGLACMVQWLSAAADAVNKHADCSSPHACSTHALTQHLLV